MNKTVKLSPHMEDYLESISQLTRKQGFARVRDISITLKVKKPSVVSALNTLAKQKLVVHERYGYVELTPQGRKLAHAIQKTHDLLYTFLSKVLHMNHRIAHEDACRMEHAISRETTGRLTKFVKLLETQTGFRDTFEKRTRKC